MCNRGQGSGPCSLGLGEPCAVLHLLRGVQVRPFGRDQRTRAVRQDQHEKQVAATAHPSQHFQRLPFERVAWAHDGYLIRIPIEVGSVSCLLSTRSIIIP